MSVREHKEHAGAISRIRCVVITVSDTRNLDTDLSGRAIHALLDEAGLPVAAYHIVPDEPQEIRRQVERAAQHADAILLSGGTGISHRDNTVDTLASLLEKELVGFGELFRMLSYGEVGSAAMLSRATGGVFSDTLVFAMPGSPKAVSLALKKLIIPELPHLLGELRKVPPR